MKLSLILIAVIFILVGGISIKPQTCGIKTETGVADTKFDRLFTINGRGLTGSDSTYSIELPDGNSAFFFSDSYIGENPAKKGDGTVSVNSVGLRTKEPNCFAPFCDPPTSIFRANNSIVIRDKKSGKLRLLNALKDENGFTTSYFKPIDPKKYYWMGDSVVVQTDRRGTKKLWSFLFEFHNENGLFVFDESKIAELTLPDLKVENIYAVTNDAHGKELAWGGGLRIEGVYGQYSLYIYGIKKLGGKKLPVVARVDPQIGLEKVSNAQNWQFHDAGNWVSEIEKASPLINRGDSISDEFSVGKIRVKGVTTYLMVTMDTSPDFGDWKDIVIYAACRPEGPFSARQVVYQTPETHARKVPGMTESQSLAGQLVTYNPHLHPQFTQNGRLLISYNINTQKSADAVYADAYRPRFIRVKVEGLE